jgi:hypothetical protein
MEPEDPPRKNYGFKEREFKRDNAPTGSVPPPPTVKELAMLAGPVTASPKGATGAKAGDPNDVFATLQRNRATEQEHGGDRIEIRKIKSKRRRDFWLMLIGGNLLIGGSVVVLGLNVFTVMFGLGGVILFSITLTWIVWQVMGRY